MFIDYLLSRDVEKELANSDSRQIPLRDDIPTSGDMPAYNEITAMVVRPQNVADEMAISSVWLQQNFYNK
jgi:hypothetical protein